MNQLHSINNAFLQMSFGILTVLICLKIRPVIGKGVILSAFAQIPIPDSWNLKQQITLFAVPLCSFSIVSSLKIQTEGDIVGHPWRTNFFLRAYEILIRIDSLR
jgi:hypothetical protein